MVNEIVVAISRSLGATFGEDYEIFRHDVEQGLDPPGFLILLLQSQRLPQLGCRTRLMHSFDVHFFPVDQADNAELYRIGDALLDALAWITLRDGTILRGVERRYEIVQGVLHCFVGYNAYQQIVKEQVVMEDLSVQMDTIRE